MEAANVSDTLKTMTNGEDSTMGSLIKIGDVGKAAQMACAVLSLVDTNETNFGSDDTKYVSNLTKAFSVFSKKCKLIKRFLCNIHER